ncbi:MAG: hypothetical protein LBL39_05005 [Planctomycetaceae bacterium]|jgi:hypothetical protein|nr:hypothetical protein [Planctomycetaceae bacterium]
MSQNSADYPQGVTFEKVWTIIQEDHKRFQDKLDKLSDKYDAIFERAAEERRKEAKKDAKKRRKEAEERRKEAEERAEIWRKETEERRKEDEERIKRLDKVVEETSRNLDGKMGDLGNRFGELAEHLVAPGIVKRFNELGYHFEGIANGRFDIVENDKTATEIDLLLENTKSIVVIEIKAKPNKRDIERHLERMAIARRYFERRGDSNKDLIGAIAGAVFPYYVKKYAIESGFYAITQSGDTMKIDFPEGFKPRIF